VREDAVAVGAVAVVVLAAGGSSRLGTPKQLVRWRGRTLLRRAAETALECARRPDPSAGRAGGVTAVPLGPVVMVLGADAPAMRAELDGLAVRVAVNRRWREGLASSLRSGLRAAIAASGRGGPAAVLFVTCDQPYVTPSLLRSLVQRFRAGAPIVACAYAKTLGIPALFGRACFGELAGLEGDAGAKRIIERHRDVVRVVGFERGATDVDTRDDRESLH
jgi:molybdenum cofactor cytidylyltransferase